jgi:hypothetical protein
MAVTVTLVAAVLQVEVTLVAAVMQVTLQRQAATQAQHWHSVTELQVAQVELAAQVESDVLLVLLT